MSYGFSKMFIFKDNTLFWFVNSRLWKQCSVKISRCSVSVAGKGYQVSFAVQESSSETGLVAHFPTGSKDIPPPRVAETLEESVRASAGGRNLLLVQRPHTCHEPSVSWDCTWHSTRGWQSRQERGDERGDVRLAEGGGGEREDREYGAQWVTDSRMIGRDGRNGVWSGSPRETVGETICLSAQGRLSLLPCVCVCVCCIEEIQSHSAKMRQLVFITLTRECWLVNGLQLELCCKLRGCLQKSTKIQGSSEIKWILVWLHLALTFSPGIHW